MHATCLAHLTLFNLMTPTVFRKAHKLGNNSPTVFIFLSLHPSCTNIVLGTPFSDIISILFLYSEKPNFTLIHDRLFVLMGLCFKK